MDLPFQIVITSELRGEEYASYRALTDRADALDVERIIEESGQETNDTLKEYYRVLIRLVIEKNPKFIEVIRRGAACQWHAFSTDRNGVEKCYGRYLDGDCERQGG